MLSLSHNIPKPAFHKMADWALRPRPSYLRLKYNLVFKQKQVKKALELTNNIIDCRMITASEEVREEVEHHKALSLSLQNKFSIF